MNLKHTNVKIICYDKSPVKVTPVYLLTGVVSARALPARPGLHVLHRVGRATEHLLAAEGARHVTGGVDLYIVLHFNLAEHYTCMC